MALGFKSNSLSVGISFMTPGCTMSCFLLFFSYLSKHISLVTMSFRAGFQVYVS